MLWVRARVFAACCVYKCARKRDGFHANMGDEMKWTASPQWTISEHFQKVDDRDLKNGK